MNFSSSRRVSVQEGTVLQLPERLAAHFLIWQAGKDILLSASPFGLALVEVSAIDNLLPD